VQAKTTEERGGEGRKERVMKKKRGCGWTVGERSDRCVWCLEGGWGGGGGDRLEM
jgi:hypothetical protein